jgi:prepilin-type N-terminal cleavage/methylation domain-containing protein
MSRYQERGFTLIELMIVIAVFGIAAGLTVPNIQQWARGYQVQRAAMDLYANMQLAKVGAIRDNQPWSLNFAPAGFIGYQVLSNAGAVVKEVKLLEEYSNYVEYGDPSGAKTFDAAVLTFNHSGFTPTTGFVFLTDKQHKNHYRVGLPLIAGSVRLEHWTGSTWE